MVIGEMGQDAGGRAFLAEQGGSEGGGVVVERSLLFAGRLRRLSGKVGTGTGSTNKRINRAGEKRTGGGTVASEASLGHGLRGRGGGGGRGRGIHG